MCSLFPNEKRYYDVIKTSKVYCFLKMFYKHFLKTFIKCFSTMFLKNIFKTYFHDFCTTFHVIAEMFLKTILKNVIFTSNV